MCERVGMGQVSQLKNEDVSIPALCGKGKKIGINNYTSGEITRFAVAHTSSPKPTIVAGIPIIDGTFGMRIFRLAGLSKKSVVDGKHA